MKLILEERGKQVTYELDESEPVVIGRGLENTVPIRESSASRRHVQVVVEGGTARVQDLGSKNGTRLNGRPLAGKTSLNPGDCIGIGDVRVWFDHRGPAPATAGQDVAPAAVEVLHTPPAAVASTPPGGVEGLHTPFVEDLHTRGAPLEEPAPEATDFRGRFCLEGAEGEFAGRRVPIDRMPFKIGRTKKNALQVHHKDVSGEHCEIVPRGDGCAIVDLVSTNGTKLNGTKVRRAILTDGARIVVGTSVALVFRDARPARPVAPASAPKEADALAPGRVASAPSGSGLTPPPPAAEVAAGGTRPGDAASSSTHEPATTGDEFGDSEALAQSAVMSSVDERGRGPLAMALIASGVALAAAALTFSWIRSKPEAAIDADPAPIGNRVANWSFEEDPAADGRIVGWTLVSGRATVDSSVATGGRRSLHVMTGAELAEIDQTADFPVGGRDIQVHGLVRGGPAALGVLFGQSVDRGFRLLSTSDLTNGRDWTEIRGVFRPPPGADHARVVLLAARETWFDRISASERSAATVRTGGQRIEAQGLTAQLDERGMFALERDGWPVFDRCGLVLASAGSLVPLARQECACELKPGRPGTGSKEKRAPVHGQAPLLSGSIVRPGGGRVSFNEDVRSEGGGLVVRYSLVGSDAADSPGVALYMEQRSRAAHIEIADDGGRRELPRAPRFASTGLREVALGTEASGVCLHCDPPVDAVVESIGSGLMLTLSARSGSREVSFTFKRGSERERDDVRLRFEEADAARRAGQLERARQIYVRIEEDFAAYPTVRERARQGERAVAARAEGALSEATAIESDIAAFGVPGLLDTAEARCRFVLEAFPSTQAAAHAEEILHRIGESRVRLVGAARLQSAEDLLVLGRQELERRRYHLAVLYLKAVLERYPDARSAVKDAERGIQFATKQMRGQG